MVSLFTLFSAIHLTDIAGEPLHSVNSSVFSYQRNWGQRISASNFLSEIRLSRIMILFFRQSVMCIIAEFYNIFLLSLLFTATRFAMHRIYANRINSRGMSRVFCDLHSQKTPRGILPVNSNLMITVHTPQSCEVFWHECAKIPRHTSQNSIAAGNLEFWLRY